MVDALRIRVRQQQKQVVEESDLLKATTPLIEKKGNGEVGRKPRIKEVTSRYMSSSPSPKAPSPSPSARRFLSPISSDGLDGSKPVRKATPERKRTPFLRARIDQTENARPLDSSAVKPEFKRFSGISSPKEFRSAISRSLDLSSSKNNIEGGQMLSSATRPLKQSTGLTKSPLSSPNSPRNVSRHMLGESGGRHGGPHLCSPRSAERTPQPLIEQTFLDTLSDCGSISSMITPTGSASAKKVTPAFKQPPSPSRSLQLSSPFRGTPSPARSRGSPFQSPSSVRSSTTSSLKCFPLDAGTSKKKALSQQEEAFSLRILHNRWLQWRFANARAEVVRSSQCSAAERSICNAWLRTAELRKSVAVDRIKLQQARSSRKLQLLLSSQGPHLESWSSIQQEHLVAVSGAVDALEAAMLRLPVTGSARADVRSIRQALGFAVDVMASLGAAVINLMPQISNMGDLVAELATISGLEIAMLVECNTLLDMVAALEVEERSLRTHLLQREGEKFSS